MLDWLKRRRVARTLARRSIPDPLWRLTLARFPFLVQPDEIDSARLREMTTLFLAQKEFTGAGGLEIDDEMAVAIAAQACLPVLNLGLHQYGGFVGIVVHADAVVARRQVEDDTGVVHEYDEELAGEAMQGGPVMLSWRDVDEAGESAVAGYNVVIHEFAHVLDMRNGGADGMPVLPDRAAREAWAAVLDAEYDAFCDRIDDGETDTLLDPYAAEAPEEFFAVASEAFFVAPHELRAEHPAFLRAAQRLLPAGPGGDRGLDGAVWTKRGEWQGKFNAKTLGRKVRKGSTYSFLATFASLAPWR